MKRKIFFLAVPYNKNDITIALESGVDAIITTDEYVESVRGLSRIQVFMNSEIEFITLSSKTDEEQATNSLLKNKKVVLNPGWEIIPVENILAQTNGLGLIVENLDQAILASGILECGVETIVVNPKGIFDLKQIITKLKTEQGKIELQAATITKIENAGLGHRVCVDTSSIFKKSSGILVGNSSKFTFLINAETEKNEYVASRPFRINAGGVHSYALLADDKTTYLSEIKPGDEIMIVQNDSTTKNTTVGRIKTEIRPMLMISAKCGDISGKVFLQNAETIRMIGADGNPISVVNLKTGDQVLCHLDEAGRHFGMRIAEEIKEL